MNETIYTDRKGIAKVLGVSTRSIDKWRETEGLPFVKVDTVVRFNVSDVLEWFHKFTVTIQKTGAQNDEA